MMRVFLPERASMSLSLDPPYSFLSSFTLSPYLSVFSECSQQSCAGDTLAIIVVLLLPSNESFKT